MSMEWEIKTGTLGKPICIFAHPKLELQFVFVLNLYLYPENRDEKDPYNLIGWSNSRGVFLSLLGNRPQIFP